MLQLITSHASCGLLLAATVLASLSPWNVGCASQEDESVAKRVQALINRLDDPNPDDRGYVSVTLGRMGDKAIPALLNALKDPRPQVRVGVVWAFAFTRPLHEPAFEPLLKLATDSDENEEVRIAAFETLLKWDPPPPKLTAAFIRATEDNSPSVRYLAVGKLLDFGADTPEVIKALQKALSDGKEDVRNSASYALSEIGPEAKAAGLELERALKDPSDNIRSHAALALARYDHRRRAQAVAALVEKLNDKDWLARSVAAGTLEKFGPVAEAAVPRLVELLDDQRTIREHAAEALGRIGPAARVAIPRLIAELEGADELNEDCKYETFFALWRIAKDDTHASEVAVRAMIAYMENPKRPDFRRRDVAHLLGSYGAKAKEALPVLKRIAQEEGQPPLARIAAASAYVRLGGETSVALPVLIQFAKQPDISGSTYNSNTQGEAVEALGELGPTAKEAVPVLLPWLTSTKNERPYFEQVALALARIDPANQTEAPVLALTKLVNAEYRRGAEDAAETLGHLGPKAVPVLAAMLKDDRLGRRKAAARALSELGPHAKVAKLELRNAFTDTTPAVRRALLDAYAKIGPSEFRDLLIQASKDRAWSVRERAVRALACDDLSAKEVRAALDTASRDADEDVYVAAKNALEKQSKKGN